MKKMITLLLAAALLTVGCAAGAGNSSSVTPAPTPAAPPSISQPSSSESSQPESSSEPESSESSREENEQLEFLSGLVKDEYTDLEMTVAILERKAILPGSAIPVSVTIKNNGDATVVYAQGSGGFTTPQALVSTADGLQPVVPLDHLGIATMDFVSKELKPGEEISFKLYVMAVEENENFLLYANELYNESSTYIAEAEWNTLKEKHDDLIAAQSGSYKGHIYFRYHTSAGSPIAEATGYAQADYDIGVTE